MRNPAPTETGANLVRRAMPSTIETPAHPRMLLVAIATVVANPWSKAGRNSISTIRRSLDATRRDVRDLVGFREQLPVVESVLVGVELFQRTVGLHCDDPLVERIARGSIFLAERERDANRRRRRVNHHFDALAAGLGDTELADDERICSAASHCGDPGLDIRHAHQLSRWNLALQSKILLRGAREHRDLSAGHLRDRSVALQLFGIARLHVQRILLRGNRTVKATTWQRAAVMFM